jgi:hypothetical protein
VRPVPDDLHPDLQPLAALLGTWRGEGRGRYPTIADFAYEEEVVVEATGKPHLAYRSRTWLLPEHRPAHVEVGFWRCAGDRVEVVLTHPFGIVEVQEGEVRVQGTRTDVVLASTAVAGTSTAKPVTEVHRTLVVDGDQLRWDIAMAAVGRPLTAHLSARLHRA